MHHRLAHPCTHIYAFDRHFFLQVLLRLPHPGLVDIKPASGGYGKGEVRQFVGAS
jgi:hypothetical protein